MLPRQVHVQKHICFPSANGENNNAANTLCIQQWHFTWIFVKDIFKQTPSKLVTSARCLPPKLGACTYLRTENAVLALLSTDCTDIHWELKIGIYPFARLNHIFPSDFKRQLTFVLSHFLPCVCLKQLVGFSLQTSSSCL